MNYSSLIMQKVKSSLWTSSHSICLVLLVLKVHNIEHECTIDTGVSTSDTGYK